MAEQGITVGVLYPGEMGAAVAGLLRARGSIVVTTLTGRSDTTARRCREAGVQVLGSLADVVRCSNVVISLVSPSSADQVADDYGRLADCAPRGALYVDANSIGPDLCKRIAQRIETAGVSFVDAAINGLAKNLTSSATLFLSGSRAGEVERLFAGAARIRVLGTQVDRASAMKMLLAGMSKGLCALFSELALVGARQGMLTEMIDACTAIYPGMMTVIDRMLPTYAQHASRRAEEMHELEQTARSADVEPCVIAAISRFHESLAAVPFGTTPCTGAAWSVLTFIEKLNEGNFTGWKEQGHGE
jgi:3-hydroxyisobutyrate dehydrogenase-like beta-hydroxyacid dehydrogenase